MKILMLTTNSSLMDGINRHILTLASAVNRLEDCEVAVCTVLPRAELVDALEKNGIRTYSLGAANGHDIRIFPALRRVMKDFNPDIVHSQVMALYERILLSALYRSRKYVRTVHGIRDEVKHETIRMKVERWLDFIFPVHYNATCYISDGVKQHLSGGKEKEGIYTIYNPMHFGKVAPKAYKLHEIIGVPNSVLIIGTSCRLAEVKNPDMFTRVMCRVLQRNPDVHAVVMGDGDPNLKERLNHIVAREHVADRFHFLGYRKDAPELVRDLSCFVLTSISEGLPTSILEAMANKTPFTMMEGNGGLKDIADLNRTKGPIGVIVPKGDIEAHATGICRLIDDPDYARALSDKAYSVGKRYFDVESVAGQLQDVYKEVCGQ